MQDLEFMDAALELAREAAAEGEVPVGCVIVRKGEIVGRGRNRRETKKTALGHGEIEAIADACKNLGGWRLWDCTLYVTLEPVVIWLRSRKTYSRSPPSWNRVSRATVASSKPISIFGSQPGTSVA